MRLPIHRKLLKRMNKTSNNNTYLRVSLVTITSLSMLFSTFHFQVQPANAQNSTNSTGILPPISQEQQQQMVHLLMDL
jgi:N-acyl-L-homoserine lactone synthetase